MVKKNRIVAFLSRFERSLETKVAANALPDNGDVVTPAESFINTPKFDIGTLLQLKTFLYLFGGTVIFLLQTYNTLTIINLARENEKLREQIVMTSSVITSQELKVHELHSIHNITQDALKIELTPSGVPAVELWP